METSKKKLLLFAALLIPVCCALYAVIILGGIGINGGSVFALALMWVPGLAALAAKLAVDHSVRGLGWHIRSLPCLAVAYFVPPILCAVVYGLAWATGLGTRRPAESAQIAVFSTLGVLIGMAASLGEEIGWRGFLLTELRKCFSPW